MKCLSLAILLVAGCADQVDVVGPFTGPTQRFVVDDFQIPTSKEEVQAMGGDLNGDGVVDNQLGHLLAVIKVQGFDTPSPHAAEMMRSGVLASSVEIQADDLAQDDAVGVRYLAADGADSTVVGGRFVDGVFEPNRTAVTAHPGAATVRLPLFLEADPVEIQLSGLEIELRPDGSGGYLAAVHGAVAADGIFPAAGLGISQMVNANPGKHLVLERLLDRNRDNAIPIAEIETNMLLSSLLAPDVRLRGAPSNALSLSFGFTVHLSPCAEGRCTTAAPPDRCHDRVLDGDETDVDCGGSCPLDCAPSLACALPTDCQSRSCVAGACAAWSCSNGLRDGFESDVDCGWPCGACGAGKACALSSDCAVGFTCSSSRDGTCVPAP